MANGRRGVHADQGEREHTINLKSHSLKDLILKALLYLPTLSTLLNKKQIWANTWAWDAITAILIENITFQLGILYNCFNYNWLGFFTKNLTVCLYSTMFHHLITP